MTIRNNSMNSWKVRKRPGIGVQLASMEEPLDIGNTESVVFDLGDYRFIVRKSANGLRISTERGCIQKGPRIALRVSQPQEIILWGEWANEPSLTR